MHLDSCYHEGRKDYRIKWNCSVTTIEKYEMKVIDAVICFPSLSSIQEPKSKEVDKNRFKIFFSVEEMGALKIHKVDY